LESANKGWGLLMDQDEYGWNTGCDIFITSERSFELTIMFSRLTNSSVTFQTMMNKILQDLINTREVANFINDIIVGTKEEKRHNKIVKEVVKRLVKNSLYIKLEKYK